MSTPETIYMDPARIVDGHTYPVRDDVAYVRKDLFDAKTAECAELRVALDRALGCFTEWDYRQVMQDPEHFMNRALKRD
jgi:hypothetical protein